MYLLVMRWRKNSDLILWGFRITKVLETLSQLSQDIKLKGFNKPCCVVCSTMTNSLPINILPLQRLVDQSTHVQSSESKLVIVSFPSAVGLPSFVQRTCHLRRLHNDMLYVTPG